MYKHILLAADGSDNAFRAAKEAIKLASLMDNCLIDIVYVADFADAKTDILHAESKKELELKRRKQLHPVVKQIKEAGINYKINILHGHPGPAIIEYANEEKPDLVVIGSRGLNTLQEMVLGSVSHKVVKRVDSPVMIIK